MLAGLRRTAVLAVLLAAMVTVAACGGDDSSSTGTQAATSGTPAATTGADGQSFCDQFAAVTDDITVDIDPSDPAIADKLTQAADALTAVQPPAEIADDWDTLITFYEQFGEGFANMDGDDEASMDKLGEAITKLQSNAKKLAGAATNVAQYAAEHC
jgi:ABC-type glycerol-3-phosphate transport system substrate-binding protein